MRRRRLIRKRIKTWRKGVWMWKNDHHVRATFIPQCLCDRITKKYCRPVMRKFLAWEKRISR